MQADPGGRLVALSVAPSGQSAARQPARENLLAAVKPASSGQAILPAGSFGGDDIEDLTDRGVEIIVDYRVVEETDCLEFSIRHGEPTIHGCVAVGPATSQAGFENLHAGWKKKNESGIQAPLANLRSALNFDFQQNVAALLFQG